MYVWTCTPQQTLSVQVKMLQSIWSNTFRENLPKAVITHLCLQPVWLYLVLVQMSFIKHNYLQKLAYHPFSISEAGLASGWVSTYKWYIDNSPTSQGMNSQAIPRRSKKQRIQEDGGEAEGLSVAAEQHRAAEGQSSASSMGQSGIIKINGVHLNTRPN